MAVELRVAGCNLNFAPMLDLNVNPESPVTKTAASAGIRASSQKWALLSITDCARDACSPARNISRVTETL